MMRNHVRRAVAALGAGIFASAILTGCGSADSAAGTVPEGWKTLKTLSVSVSYPPGMTEQGEAERSTFNTAAATLTEGGKTVGVITVQLDFTDADSAEEAAIGAEAGIQLGSTLLGQQDVKVAGTDDAKRIDFEFSSTGEADTPSKGTRIGGVIVTGLDSKGKTFAVRIDAQKGKLDDADLKKIIDSIEVR